MSDGGGAADTGLSYGEAKRRIQDQDPEVRADLAQRQDVRPEVLYYLAEDPSPKVRRRVAANETTPYQADAILAGDADAEVRASLGEKVARILPDLGPSERQRAQVYVEEVLERLARDEAVRVRQVLAEALKSVSSAPAAVIGCLARDSETVVAAPVLEFSPVLGDDDLIEIIDGGCASGPLQAISRRTRVSPSVADAVVAVDDEAAVTALLANDNAQIREETLERLVERARQVSAWQEPLVVRPTLSMKLVGKLAAFVADRLLDRLQDRADLDAKTARALKREVKKRLKQAGRNKTGGSSTAAGSASPAAEVKALQEAGNLDEQVVKAKLDDGERDFVREALAAMAGLPVATVDKVLGARSSKGVTSLSWKAGLSPGLALQLQTRLGGIPPQEALRPRGGTLYPLTAEEMTWQLELFETMAG